MDRLREATAFRNRLFRRLPALATEGHCRVPNWRFWDHYKANRDLYYNACVGVQKLDDGWHIIAYEFKDMAFEEHRAINEMLQRHSVDCSHCGQQNEIERSFMKDARVLYMFYCRDCSSRNSTALPHKLVNHCIDTLAIAVFDRKK